METEEMNEVETTEEMTPEKEVMAFADSIADKAAMVESGDMTVSDFVSECMDTLGKIEVDSVAEDSPMGGLGAGKGDFPLPDEEA